MDIEVTGYDDKPVKIVVRAMPHRVKEALRNQFNIHYDFNAQKYVGDTDGLAKGLLLKCIISPENITQDFLDDLPEPEYQKISLAAEKVMSLTKEEKTFLGMSSSTA
jgi:hypothetical protein